MSRTSSHRLGDDRGFMIIEVLVSALILIMASLAVFSALDNADKAAGNQQTRTMAANYAQSELERIRSLPVEDIAALRGTRTFKRDNVDFTVTTTAKWVSDGDDEPKCTSRTGGVDYMRTTVSISWKGMGQSRPVSFTSLFTPTAGAGGDTGSLSVNLMNRNGGPVPGVGVTLSGPATFTGTTNKNGCVVFAFVPESLEYEVSFARAGYVNEQSVGTVQSAATVTARETTKLQFLYDSGGFTRADFVARPSASADPVPTAPAAFQMFHPEQSSPGITTNLAPGATSYEGAGRPWFPFTTPYSIYAGNCPKNAPPSTVAGGQLTSLVNITPLAMQNTGRVQIPGLGMTVYRGTPLTPIGPATAARVEVDADCGVKWVKQTGSDGRLTDTGVPYSQVVRVCALVNGPQGWKRLIYARSFNTAREFTEIPPLYYGGDNGANTTIRNGNSASCFD